MTSATLTKTRKAEGADRLPVLSDEQAEKLLDRTGDYGLRCFLGIHRKAVYLWPTGDGPKVSRQVTCFRCGETLDRQLLPSKKASTRAADTAAGGAQPGGDSA